LERGRVTSYQGVVLLMNLALILLISHSLGALAYATGAGKRASAVLGTLMNTRGLTELIMLNAGLQSGVLTSNL
jgi:Kef-type K+ transport system membrane component KefB